MLAKEEIVVGRGCEVRFLRCKWRVCPSGQTGPYVSPCCACVALHPALVKVQGCLPSRHWRRFVGCRGSRCFQQEPRLVAMRHEAEARLPSVRFQSGMWVWQRLFVMFNPAMPSPSLGTVWEELVFQVLRPCFCSPVVFGLLGGNR